MFGLSIHLDAFLVHLEIERGLSRNTVDAYRRDLGRFLEGLPEGIARQPERLAEEHVFDFLVAERQRGREVTSVRRSLSAVKTFLRYLRRERVLADDPAANLESPRAWHQLPVVLNTDQVQRLLQTVATRPARYRLRNRALLETMYACGLRVSEVCQLTTRSLRRDLGIVLCLGKGSRERVVPISRTALEAIEQYEAIERPRLSRRHQSDILFLSRGGRPLGREVVRALLRRYALQAGLPGHITPHTLRHSMATHLLRGGADLRTVQEILGHVKLTTTEIYTHLDRSDLKAAHRKYHPRG